MPPHLVARHEFDPKNSNILSNVFSNVFSNIESGQRLQTKRGELARKPGR
jgi:hypothetical protein